MGFMSKKMKDFITRKAAKAPGAAPSSGQSEAARFGDELRSIGQQRLNALAEDGKRKIANLALGAEPVPSSPSPRKTAKKAAAADALAGGGFPLVMVLGAALAAALVFKGK